jgi:uncharacterized protein
MKLEELPLLDIFNSLRQRHGLPLGVEEYLVVVRSLEAGFGISNKQELEQLCCMLWAKSEEDNRLIRRLFEQMWRHSPAKSGKEDKSTENNISKPTPEDLQVPSVETPSLDEPLPDLKTTPTITPEPVQAVQAVRSSRVDREMKRPRYMVLTEYFPVTKRQMKQCWRYLRRPVRQGVPTELDVEATVAKIGRKGILLQPVMMPPRTNRTDLVLLIDQEGSMVPFHDLSRQLVETAERGGRLRTTNVFYFHDYPDEYLYRHPAMLDAKAVSEVLEEIGERAAVLIISDAGAARGNFDQERVDSTKVWIDQLQQSVRYYAWLNPMPSECWRQTTAGEIARFVPMFEMSSQGMNAAISVLRGRYVDRHNNLLEVVQINENANDLINLGNSQFLSQETLQNLNQRESSAENEDNNSYNLTEVELEVLKLILKGCSHQIIAKRLYINLGAISHNIRKIVLKKLLFHALEAFDNEEIIKDYNFTNRELEVLQLIVEGCRYQVIAERLHIKFEAVSEYIQNILYKLYENIARTLISPEDEEIDRYTLTERELEVLQLIVEGYSNPVIAERLYITVGTVKTHVRNILNKLCADDRTQAAVRALRSGLVG